MAKLSAHLRGDIRLFAFFLANRTVAPDLLSIDGDDDYRPNLVTFGSELEMVFAIFTNVLEIDENGDPTNASWAQRRAAQWIRSYVDPSYVVDHPFEEWETELHL